ncbi:MAG: hypothetical protein J3Q66DRAFT_435468 [Benniella sp.]|nr:MAG: hypothetical protein J3Q66DRAFT_435468 [Benniella sp.]
MEIFIRTLDGHYSSKIGGEILRFLWHRDWQRIPTRIFPYTTTPDYRFKFLLIAAAITAIRTTIRSAHSARGYGSCLVVDIMDMGSAANLSEQVAAPKEHVLCYQPDLHWSVFSDDLLYLAIVEMNARHLDSEPSNAAHGDRRTWSPQITHWETPPALNIGGFTLYYEDFGNKQDSVIVPITALKEAPVRILGSILSASA